MNSDITLQINLCPGDIAYAERVARHLSACHRDACAEVILVLDRCRPQSSQFLHAETRFPAEQFAVNCRKITAIAESLIADGIFDRLVILDPQSPLFASLSSKYLGGIVDQTHDCFGHASMAYYAGIESARTRYLLHYDGDILLYQKAGYQWTSRAIRDMQADPRIVACSARISPPGAGARPQSPAVTFKNGGGWLDAWRLEPHPHGWLSDWFSTRCFLLDRERLDRCLPLAGRTWSGPFGRRDVLFRKMIHRLLRNSFRRGSWTSRSKNWIKDKLVQSARFRLIPVYPDPPEVLMHQVIGGAGGRCLYLDDPDAWFIHPDTKPQEFLDHFEEILAFVSSGHAPEGQIDHCSVLLKAWHPQSPAMIDTIET